VSAPAGTTGTFHSVNTAVQSDHTNGAGWPDMYESIGPRVLADVRPDRTEIDADDAQAVIANNLIGSRWDPLGPILAYGCRK
jgi:hypothetical protein